MLTFTSQSRGALRGAARQHMPSSIEVMVQGSVWLPCSGMGFSNVGPEVVASVTAPVLCRKTNLAKVSQVVSSQSGT